MHPVCGGGLSDRAIYREPEENEVSLSRKHVEGNFIYRIVGTDTFVMMMDEYTNGRFFYSRQKIWSI